MRERGARGVRRAGGMRDWGDGSPDPQPLAERRPAPAAAWRGTRKLERLAASPGTAAKLMRMNGQVDVRAVLPTIQAPTLVLHRAGRPVHRHPPLAVPRRAHPGGASSCCCPAARRWRSRAATGGELDEVEEFLTGDAPGADPERVLATVMFADIVDSTRRAAELGDRRWRELLEAITAAVGRELERFRGRAIKTMGDGLLATFDGPARAIRCAAVDPRAGARAVRPRGPHRPAHRRDRADRRRRGRHRGAHRRARGGAGARAGEVLVSGTVKDLVAGSGIDVRGPRRARAQGRARPLAALGGRRA